MGMGLKFSENIIICGEKLYEGCSTTMAVLRNYEFYVEQIKQLNQKYSLLTWIFMNASNHIEQ